MLYNSFREINFLLLSFACQRFLSSKLCLYCKPMALVLCKHNNMLIFIAHVTLGSKSTIRCADKLSKLITAPHRVEMVGWRALLVGCGMRRVEYSHWWGRRLCFGQAWGQGCWHIPHEFPCTFNRGLTFSQFISWREAFVASVLIKEEINFFAHLSIDSNMMSNHILSYLYVTTIPVDISTARYWSCICEWPSE